MEKKEDNIHWNQIHEPVLLSEVIDCLRCHPAGVYIDGTCGLGGHAEAILKATHPDGRLVAVDRDQDALERARLRLAPFGARVRFVHDNYRNLPLILNGLGIPSADGILLDLGISSLQLSQSQRGFSFQENGFLDMRMDRTQGTTARDLVNHLEEKELADLIWKYGEEKASRRIARAIVLARAISPIQNTLQLADMVQRAVRRSSHRVGRIHPATRTFQALRIAVNGELENLESLLNNMTPCISAGGRLAIISFHSLEDRLVKTAFRRLAGQEERTYSQWDVPVTESDREEAPFRLVARKALRASDAEKEVNPRSRSARLRCLEKRAMANRNELVKE